jgi:DNA-binding transcriptional LysR family regulator
MDKLETIRVFVEAAVHQSFVAASRNLDMSAPAVTRAIAQLEASLGVKLFNRTTRHVRLTDAGERFLSDMKHILEDLEHAEAAASGSYVNPKGTLSITAPVLFGQKYIIPIVTEYLERNPAVSVKAVFYDRISNMLEEGLEVAIRIGHLQDASFYATHVGNVRRVVCGSPDYFVKYGIPQRPADLVNHKIIMASTVESSMSWKFMASGAKEIVKVTPHLDCNQNGAAVNAAILGCGVTRLMSYQVGEDIKSGKLQKVLDGYETEPLPINIIHLEGRRTTAKIRSFIDLCVKRLRSNPFIN